jgi:hypothetical protein
MPPRPGSSQAGEANGKTRRVPADLTGEGRPYCGLSGQNVAIIMKPEAAQ